MNIIQKLSIAYAVMFFSIAGAAYIPAFIDDAGLFMGLFTLDFHDNLLHGVSGLWALIAGLISSHQAAQFFKIFGTIYFLDGVVGLFFGNAFLDLGLYYHGIADYTLMTKIMTNIPHILIGGSSMLIGFWLAKRYVQNRQAL